MIQPPLWRIGAVMLLAMTLIVGGDSAATVLSRDGIDPIFTAWTRFALAGAILLPFCGLTRADAPGLRDARVWLRALLIVGGICCILTALRTEQVADTFGAFFIGPIVAFILSALLLRERITVARTALLALSFLGVLIVVRPGFGMSVGIGFALLAGVLHGSYVVATRWAAPDHRPRFLLISQLLIGAVLLAPFGLSVLPSSLDLTQLILITLSALGSALGNLLMVTLSRTTPSSVIAPLIYTQLLSATFFGFVVFSELPDSTSILGLVIIFCSGVAGLALARR